MNRLDLDTTTQAIRRGGAQPAPVPEERRRIIGQVFAVLASAWPKDQHTATEPTMRLWAHVFADVPGDVMTEAAELAVRTFEWWPTIKAFGDTIDSVKVRRHRAAQYAQTLALPEGRDIPLAYSKVREIRAELRSRP